MLLSDTVSVVLAIHVSNAPYSQLGENQPPVWVFAKVVDSPEDLQPRKLHLQKPRTSLVFQHSLRKDSSNHWRALTGVEAKSGPALCILVMGSRRKYDGFFSFISGQREMMWLCCDIRKAHQHSVVCDSKWVARLRGRLWGLEEGTDLGQTVVWEPIRGAVQRTIFNYY